MENYLTIKELIDKKYLKKSTLISGESGLENKAKNILILETPDGMDWLKGNEFVLTAGYAFIENQKYKRDLIKTAYEKNVAAIGIKVGRYFGAITEELISDSDKYGIPIFLLEREAVYSNYVNKFYDLLFNKENENILNILKSYYKLLSKQTEGACIEDIIDEVQSLTGLSVSYKKFNELLENPKSECNYYIPIKHDDNIFGYLIVNDRKKGDLSDFQEGCINYALSLLKNIIISEQNILLAQSVNNRIITEILLSGQRLDDRFYESITNYLEWKNEEYYAVYFKWTDKSPMNSRIRQIIEFSLNEKFLFTEDGDNMVIFISANDKNSKDTIKRISRIYKNLKIGVSTLKHSLTNLNQAYKEALNICEISKKSFAILDDHSNYKILLKILDNEETKEYLYSSLSKLTEYDSKHDTQLLITLRVYLKNNLNKKNTSEELHIHIETLRYRLARIKDITGLDASKIDDLFYLMLVSYLSVYELS